MLATSAVPPSATNTATATPTTTSTATPTSAATATATPASTPVVVPLTILSPRPHASVVYSQLGAQAQTTPDASVTVTVRILSSSGATLYRFTGYGQADTSGYANVPVRSAYIPSKPAPAQLTVQVATTGASTQKSIPMTVTHYAL